MKQSRGVEADVVAHIGEVELRRLYAQEACSSMFEYCRRVLGLRENEAYLRITVARAARELPELLPMLRDGRLHLSGIARLAPHLTRQKAEKFTETRVGDVPSGDPRARLRAGAEARRRPDHPEAPYPSLIHECGSPTTRGAPS